MLFVILIDTSFIIKIYGDDCIEIAPWNDYPVYKEVKCAVKKLFTVIYKYITM